MRRARPPGGDRVLLGTRLLAAAVLPFLVVAVAILYLAPGATDRLFAWTIRPPLSALLLGSTYLGGIYFFAAVRRAARWSAVRHGFPAVAVFAALAGMATVLHWDRFHFGHVSFVAWAALYAVTPVWTLAAWYRNLAEDDGAAEAGEARLARPLRLALGAAGVPPLLCGLALFAFPAALLSAWAWELTPLTARVTGAVLTLPGVVGLGLFGERRWHAVKVLLGAQLVSLTAVLAALLRARADLLWERPAALFTVAGLGAYWVFYGAVYAALERRRVG